MKGLPVVLIFTAMTFMAWGSYGPVLHHGSLAFNSGGKPYYVVPLVFGFAPVISTFITEIGTWSQGPLPC